MHLIAHSGGQGPFPSNSLNAVKESVKQGIRYVEVDVRKGADSRLRLSHGPLTESLESEKADLLSDLCRYAKEEAALEMVFWDIKESSLFEEVQQEARREGCIEKSSFFVGSEYGRTSLSQQLQFLQKQGGHPALNIEQYWKNREMLMKTKQEVFVFLFPWEFDRMDQPGELVKYITLCEYAKDLSDCLKRAKKQKLWGLSCNNCSEMRKRLEDLEI
ncbi:MAG: hypothetical protein KUL82_09350 [Bdellovibrio sp.]|nr:hypothetical protein [Bdellovibrio sp.]